MRFDRLRRRVLAASAPPPHSPPLSSSSSAPSRYPSDVATQNSHLHPPDISRASSLPLQSHNTASMSRMSYIRALEARMAQMEKVPTSSFFHSYAGEFDALLGEDRRATRRLNEFETSTRVENAYRNRYANILSNEDTRVKLIDVAPGDNDYINANRVTGHHGHPGYIATQAPLPETTPHFWQMVYESVSPVIIMLTREQEDHCEMSKSDQYWPGVSQDLLFNDYMVHGLDERIHEVHGVIERRFQVGKVVDKRKKHGRDLVDADSLIAPSAESSAWQTPARGRNHGHHQLCGDDDQLDCIDNEELLQHLELIGPVLEVVQLQYVDWPDQNVPTSPNTLLELCQRVEVLLGEHTARTKVSAPPIVHCSAGVGRTGTFIAVDTTLRRLWDAFAHGNEANGCDDDVVERGPQEAVHVEEIRELVRKMKNERSKMVQTAEQYRFIYHAVLAGMKKWEGGDVLFGNVGNDGLLGNGQLTDDDAVRLWHDQQSTDQKG